MADRIIILTTRPGTIKRIISIDLTHLGPPLKRRESETAHKLFDEIWKDLLVYNPKSEEEIREKNKET